MAERGSSNMQKTIATALVAVLTPGPAFAQQEFKLPPGGASPAAPAPGPTDSDAPAPRAMPSLTPTPAPSPTATPAASALPRPSPSASPSPSANRSPRAGRSGSPRPNPSASASPTASASEEPSINESAPMLNGGPSAVPSVAAVPPAAPGDSSWLLWLAIAIGAAALAVISFLLGRRSAKRELEVGYVASEPEPEPLDLTEAIAEAPAAKPKTKRKPKAAAEPEVVAEAAPEPLAIEPEIAVTPEPGPEAPLPRPAFHPHAEKAVDFEIELVPQRMTMALINASLSYRLTILNRDAKPLGPLRISCDLISAHASLQAAEQLEPDPEKAWMSHDFEALPPGEHLVVDGEVRLPRAEILPVRSGGNHLFVPLVRFTVQTVDGDATETVGARVFVIGEEPEQAGGALKPFRLNDGTRSYSRIAQREVTIAA